jgi:thiamine-monophosphate kinase
MSEFDLIAKYFTRHSKRSDVLLNVGDDAAVLQVPAHRRLVAAVDTIVEGVHFPVGTDPAAIGHRALAVNLSDIAAMGAEPAWMTLSLSLPQNDARWLNEFSKGLFALADRFNVALVGGDTVRGSLNISVQALGLVETDGWLTRSGAKPGDAIFISGNPGEAAAGLNAIQKATANSSVLIERFLWPEPRVHLGRAIREIASAAIDVSDGLLADLEHITSMSRCAASIDLSLLPISTAMRAAFDTDECEKLALSGGDVYELLFTVPKNKVSRMTSLPIHCTQIGEVLTGTGVQCHRSGKTIEFVTRGYDHFA